MVKSHIFYTGSVQGVGFRYTVQSIASGLNLTGWVRNRRDGRVEIVVEGEKGDIEKLLEEINRHFLGYIRKREVVDEPFQKEFRNFQIAPTV